MSHRPQTRQIFALLDNRLTPTKRTQFVQHLSKCSICREYHDRVKRHRRLARDSFNEAVPDWEAIDSSIDKTITRLTDPSGRTKPIIYPRLVFIGAAAMLAVAVVAVLNSEPPPIDHPPSPQPALVAINPAPPAPLLVFRVEDSLHPDIPPPIGSTIALHGTLTVPDSGAVRLSLGSQADIEALDSTALSAVDLNPRGPVLGLERGRVAVAVSPYAFETGLRVLCAEQSIHILEGLVELVVEADSVTVTVREGVVFGDSQAGALALEQGSWRIPRHVVDAQQIAWRAVDRLTIPDHPAPETGAVERTVKRIKGSLPKSMVRTVFEAATPKIRSCYEAALKRNAGLELSLQARLNVDRSGTVQRTRLSGIEGPPELKQCLTNVFTALRFPAPRGGPVEVIFPMHLHPRDR